MAELNPPSFMQNRADQPANQGRLLISALVADEGCVGDGDLLVSAQATPDMSVSVAAGDCFIAGDESTTQGTYHAHSDAAVTLSVAASDATNPRKDIVVAEVRDAFYSGADNLWRLRVIAGTPAATPTEPALPSNALKLATIDVAANASSVTSADITDTRTFSSAPGVSPNGGDTITASAADVIPLTVKGAASQTANLFEARDSAGTVLARVSNDGSFVVEKGVLRVNNTTSSATPLRVTGAASQSANLFEARNSLDNNVAEISAAGIFRSTVIGAGDNRLVGTTLSSEARAANEKPLVVRGAASQSANLAEFQNSAGTVLAEVRSNGAFNAPRIEPHSTVATSVPLFVKGAASQTSDLTQWHDSAGTVLMAVTAAGRTKFNALDGTAALGAYQGFINVTIGGTVRKIGIYA